MKNSHLILLTASIAAAVLITLGFKATTNSPASQKGAEEINVYSARKAELMLPLMDEFFRETGREVDLVPGKDGAVVKRLQVEGKGSPADVLITVDAGRLHRATRLLCPHPLTRSLLAIRRTTSSVN